MPPDDPDHLFLVQARDRARVLLEALNRDAESLRQSEADAVRAEGAALCQQAAEETRQLIAQLEAELSADPAEEKSQP